MLADPEKDAASQQFLTFVRNTADELRSADKVPATLEEWTTQRRSLRENLERSWGPFPTEHCGLEPRILGEDARDGYRVERVVFQTRPDIWMTANAYVPDGSGKRPAVLCVHGHWRGAKQDPVVQSRCIGLAKLGFFVLAVDAFGAGERGLAKPLGEYHGEMVAATLWPTGLALSGLQVYENMRAADYLQSRTEVDPDRLGITGTSGGGNQTMYTAAYDERFGCAVPACSVGTYRSYLGAACCMCEVVPGALRYTEEWGLLAMVAPRALMLINATQDSFQFSVGQAALSYSAAREVFALHGQPDRIRHAIFESKHDYNQPMREAMYGWMTLHLKGECSGEPIPEPSIETVDREALRCFPGESRPDTFITVPQFAARVAHDVLKTQTTAPDHLEWWETDSRNMLDSLISDVLGPFPARERMPLEINTSPDGTSRLLRFEPEPGLGVLARHEFGHGRPRRLAVLVDLDGMQAASDWDVAQECRKQGYDLLSIELRATGSLAHPQDRIGRAVDHNTAEWSMWIGRPLLGQWVWDLSRLLDVVGELSAGLLRDTTIVARGPAGVLALAAAALDPRIRQVALVDSLASFMSDEPYQHGRLGILVPGMLRSVGDIPQLASLVAPRRLLIAGGVTGSNRRLAPAELRQSFDYTSRVYGLLDASSALKVTEGTEAAGLVGALK